MKPIKNLEVAAVVESYPPKFERKLLALRELILETAASTEGIDCRLTGRRLEGFSGGHTRLFPRKDFDAGE